ncbi:MAG: TIGR04219 family outer membrane beta-barrel protein [Alteromonadales bacterium]|nr:TIGR04219 family outer membrane beta-barrel protein [Alteromonadales bacterium]
MIKRTFVAMVAALFTIAAQADTVGLSFGGQIWQNEANGILGEKNSLIDFDLQKEQQNNYFIAVEHPFPFFPNLRISGTTLNTIGKTDLTQDFSFDDEIFHVGGTETSTDDHTGANVNTTTDVNFVANLNVSYVDYTLYYELFNNGVFSFDLGLTARSLNGDVTVTGTTTTVTTVDEAALYDHIHTATEETNISTAKGKIKTDEIEPMLYVATKISLPLTCLSVFAQGNISLKDEHTLYDYQVGLDYDLVHNRLVDVNLTLGYRLVEMELDNLNNLYTDLGFKGTFIGVVAHF